MPRIKDPFIAIRFNKSGQKVLGFQSGQASVSTSSSMRSVAGLTCGGRRWQHRQQRIRSPQQPGKDHLKVESGKTWTTSTGRKDNSPVEVWMEDKKNLPVEGRLRQISIFGLNLISHLHWHQPPGPLPNKKKTQIFRRLGLYTDFFLCLLCSCHNM